MLRLEFTIQRYEINGPTTLWFDSKLHHLEFGSFSGSFLDIECPGDDSDESFEIEILGWKPFVQTLEWESSLRFATVLNPYMRGWYQKKAAEREPVSWLNICGYDVSRKRSWNDLPRHSIQIHRATISTLIESHFGLDWISLTYNGLTRVHWS